MLEDLFSIQQNILIQISKDISLQKIHYWIYNNESIVFDFLVYDYFISVSYNKNAETINFILRNQSKIGNKNIFENLKDYIKEQYTYRFPSEHDTRFSFSYKYIDDSSLEKMLSEVLNKTYFYLKDNVELIDIYNAEDIIKQAELFDALLGSYPSNYIGISNEKYAFFLSHARNHNQSEIVHSLHRKGFIAVEHQVGVTVFRRIDRQNYKDFLKYFPESFSELNHIFYTVEKPKKFYPKNNLLILFSYTNQCNENPMDRYYTHSFPFIANNILPNTYIVRICDFADAFGSHGLNTEFDSNIENNIQDFIKKIMELYSINKENVLIMGASSGGTGALYHGLIGGYKTYAIDPYLGGADYYNGKDPLYLKTLKLSIQDVFKALPEKIFTRDGNSYDVLIISSEKSEFYRDISQFKLAMPSVKLCVYNSDMINKHTDVSPNVVFLSNTFVNNLLSGIPMISVKIDLLDAAEVKI